MKKLALILMCLLIATSAFAQTNKFGFALGLNNTFITGSDWKDMRDGVSGDGDFARPSWAWHALNAPGFDAGGSLTAGFEAGFFFQIAINEMFSIQPEFNIIQTSVKMYSEITGQERTQTIRQTWFEIPVLARVNLEAGPGSLGILAGPSLLVNPFGGMRSYINTTNGQEITRVGDSEFGPSVAFAGIIGASYVLPAADGFIMFDARYRRAFSPTMGWTEISGTPAVTGYNPGYLGRTGDKHNARANTISLRVGYGFSL